MMIDITAWILSSSALILVVAALRCLLRGSVADNAGGEASFKCRFCEKYLFKGLAFRKKGARAMAHRGAASRLCASRGVIAASEPRMPAPRGMGGRNCQRTRVRPNTDGKLGV